MKPGLDFGGPGLEKLRPQVALYANDDASVVASPGCCDIAQTPAGEILASATCADILTLPRRDAHRVHLQREHELGSLSTYFTVYEELPALHRRTAPTWPNAKVRVRHDPHNAYDLITPFVLDDEFLALGEDLPHDGHAQHEGASVLPVDSGRIQYTMVGTEQPKPR
ncbi:hypothetical protein BDN71DRAFT_1277542 [Pleurotus eryngii]|uniref:Uncharacterized protein n=1 Tax=Pleurotus eryngii TaxID=5323 RepID=A0A9P5ZQI4_PLEER|nr:hypothetical protein BDN71DRAFT_1277542 [Pleurotus eryngii]